MVFEGASCAVRFAAGEKNCFVRIPRSWDVSVDKVTVLEITSDAITIFVTPSGYTPNSPTSGGGGGEAGTTIELNGLFAEKQGLRDGQMVYVRRLKSAVPQCQSIQVDPLSPDEWEILEQNAQKVENTMLNQVRAVWTGAKLPVWVTDRICTFVRISSLVPSGSECALLHNFTEVRVCPKVRDRSQAGRAAEQLAPPAATGADRPAALATAGNRHLAVPDRLGAGTERLSPATERARSPQPQLQSPSSSSGRLLRSSVDSAMAAAAANAAQSAGGGGSTGGDAPSSLWSLLVSSVLLGTAKKRKSPVSPESSLSFVERSNSVALDDHYLNADLDLMLRVQVPEDEEHGGGSGLQQEMERWHGGGGGGGGLASVCYLSIESMGGSGSGCCIDMGRVKPYFLACVSKLNSPGELEDVYRSNRRRLREDVSASSISSAVSGAGGGGGNGSVSNRGTLDRQQQQRRQTAPGGVGGSLRPYEDGEKEVALGVVRVVVVELAAAAGLRQQRLQRCPGDDYRRLSAPGHLALAQDFCTLHDLTATSRVRLVALQSSQMPSPLERLELHATCSLDPSASSDQLRIAFGHHLDLLRMDGHPVVLNCHDRLRFPVAPDKVGEFVVIARATGQAGRAEADKDWQPPAYFSLDRSSVDVAHFILDPLMKWEPSCCEPAGIPRLGIHSLGGFDSIFSECEAFVRHSFLVAPASSGLLICGSKGCGKTSLARAVMRRLYEYPCLCYSAEVDCKKLRGKRLDSLQQHLNSVMGEAIWRQPSVVLLDDIHAIARAAVGPEEELGGEVIYCSRVTEIIRDLLKKLTAEGHRVSVIATCLSKGTVQQRLFSTSGIHFFQKTVEIPQPDREQRAAVLKSLLLSKVAGWGGGGSGASSVSTAMLDLEVVAKHTDGFYPADLASVVDRALLAQQMKRRKGHQELTVDHFMLALVGFTPCCLRDVPLHIASDVTWNDVGGLATVKRTLIQMLEWPKKYPALYAQCPIRLQSGVLLFGPPGTGKTLLASAVAKETGLNFISIKGPELLSKYIGASEQAVRTTFARAQSAKPCILFFDEFDSFAPKRGHDSTGVTDRVVNQLLTHLDGLEALTGVYVLAASSRPDLIDPALLRPGRLDKSIYCPIPDASERCEILQALSRKLHLGDGVDLAEIAKQCQFFTGADLKALLGNAQLAAAHEHLAERKRKHSPSTLSEKRHASSAGSLDDLAAADEIVEGVYAMTANDEWQDMSTLHDKPTLSELHTYVRWIASRHRERSQVMREPLSVVVNQAHLLAAAAHTQPSVSAPDREHYEQVYRNFLMSKESQFASLRPEQAKQKITLA